MERFNEGLDHERKSLEELTALAQHARNFAERNRLRAQASNYVAQTTEIAVAAVQLADSAREYARQARKAHYVWSAGKERGVDEVALYAMASWFAAVCDMVDGSVHQLHQLYHEAGILTEHTYRLVEEGEESSVQSWLDETMKVQYSAFKRVESEHDGIAQLAQDLRALGAGATTTDNEGQSDEQAAEAGDGEPVRGDGTDGGSDADAGHS